MVEIQMTKNQMFPLDVSNLENFILVTKEENESML